MFAAFDSLYIDVPDLASACDDYTALLGIAPTGGQFPLDNITLTLRQSADGNPARLAALSLLDPALPPGASVPLQNDCRGLTLLRGHRRDPGKPAIAGPPGIHAVDHIVLRSADADDCIRLFGEELGLRLALDQTVPEYGGRMVFFRHGKLTLEVIQPLRDPPEQDTLWGVTYLCRNINATVAALDRRGVALSAVRTGRKPGTRVATVRSHCLGLPTLLIASD